LFDEQLLFVRRGRGEVEIQWVFASVTGKWRLRGILS
jgi:hypothetical protein